MQKSEVRVIFISTLIIAISSIVYELLIGTIATYFLGNSVYQFSITIGLFMFSAGLGSFLSARIGMREITSFIIVEILISVIGGLSSLILIFSFAYTRFSTVVMFLLLIVIGILTGLEIPLLVRILKRYFDLKFTISQILAFDYIGALIGSVVFPMVMLPYLGIGLTGILMGIFNILVAVLNAFYFRKYLKFPRVLRWVTIGCFVLLFIIGLNASKITVKITGALYQDKVVWSKQTKYQNVVLTKFKDDYRMYIDGNLQFSSVDEYRYHEVLVHPAASLIPVKQEILVLGAGDGLVLRELFKYPDIGEITLVDIDREIIELCRTNPVLRKLNKDSLNNPRVNIVIRDAYKYLEETDKIFNLVVIDLPDPNNHSISKLYSKEFYKLVYNHLSADGIVVTQSSSPFFSPDAFWCVHNTLGSVFNKVVAMNVYVPSFGLWGFNMASKYDLDISRISIQPKTRFLNDKIIDEIFIFPKDLNRRETKINRIHSPVLQLYYWKNWNNWRGF